jgi:N-methylhydantoinase B
MAVTITTKTLRELGDAEFADRYGTDRFTATVLANRLRYVVEHMCGGLLTAAFSPVLRDFYDFAATIAGPPSTGWVTPAVSNSIVLFTGTMTDSVRTTVQEFGIERLVPGDVVVVNDPYRTGTHVNDLLLVRPVFADGEIVAFVNLKAHQLDMGGSVPGGFSTAKRTVYENGLVLSPRLLHHAGRPVHETWSLIFDNVRFGEILLPDLQTIGAQLELGERLIGETVARYGAAALHGAMRYVCDAGAERMAAGLAAMEDGSWVGEDVMDCDGVDDTEDYVIRARVTKRGSRVEVDLSGTSRQARTCINATALDAKTTVGVALKYLFDPRGSFTSGTWRCVDLVVPDGTIVSALPPDGAVFAYYEQNQVLLSALLRAFAQPLGARAIAGDKGGTDIHNAYGVHADGRPWVSVASCGGEIGPYGATAAGDADSQMLSYQANGIAVSAEAIEADAPAVMLRHEIVPDTAGPGQHRGGAAMVRDTLWRTGADHSLMALRYRRAPGFGVNGGGDGRTGGVWAYPAQADGDAGDGTAAGEHGPAPEALWPPIGDDAYRDATALAGVVDPQTGGPAVPGTEGDYVYPFATPTTVTQPGTVLRFVTNAGGGWGSPLDREPERVRDDVRDGYLTMNGAARLYGVVVVGDPERDPEGLRIDFERTQTLREGMR